MLQLQNLGSLYSFLLDVLAIVVGLTLSFMIDEWRNRRKKLKNERAILQSIRLDLEADIKYANRSILRGEWAIKQMRELLDPKTCSISMR